MRSRSHTEGGVTRAVKAILPADPSVRAFSRSRGGSDILHARIIAATTGGHARDLVARSHETTIDVTRDYCPIEKKGDEEVKDEREENLSSGGVLALADPLAGFSEFGLPELFPPGTALFQQEHRPTVLRLIVSGFVKTIRREPVGDALVAVRGPGWILGLAPALLSRPYTTSGFTATSCTLRSLGVPAFEHHLQQSPALAAWVLRLAVRQNLRDDLLRAEMAVYKASDRVVRTLLRFVNVLEPPRRNGQLELALPITLTELAQMVGVTPEYLRHLLSNLEAEGALRRRRGVILLPLDRWQKFAADQLVED